MQIISKEALPSRVSISYIFDYVIIVVFIVVFSALDKAEPFHQRFSLNNISLQYPYADPERIAPWLAAIVSCAFPLVVIVLWTLFIDGIFSHSKKIPSARRQVYGRRGKYTMKERLWEMNCGILGLGLSVAAAICITGALKNATGKPRPDIIARCQPREGSQDAAVFGLVTSEICTGDAKIIRDGFKSWPSGHSSTAFAGLGYLSIYLGGKLHVLDNRGEVWKTVLIIIPIIAASLVAISRIMDARHHPFDVISSSILGLVVAWGSYRQYFPSLSETWKKGHAHPMREWGKEPSAPEGFVRAPDEEDGRAGYMAEPISKIRTTTGAEHFDVAPTERRRQYLEEQDTLDSRRRQAHGYDQFIGPVGGGESGGMVYPQSAPPGVQTYPHRHNELSDESSSEDTETYEMSERRARVSIPVAPKSIEKAYQGYQPPTRQDTHSPTMTTTSQESEDRKWGIAQATSAISTGGAGVSAVAPIPEGNASSSRKNSETLRTTDGLRRIELRDG